MSDEDKPMRIDFVYTDFAAREKYRQEARARSEAVIAIEVARRTSMRSTGFWARLWFVLTGR